MFLNPGSRGRNMFGALASNTPSHDTLADEISRWLQHMEAGLSEDVVELDGVEWRCIVGDDGTMDILCSELTTERINAVVLALRANNYNITSSTGGRVSAQKKS